MLGAAKGKLVGDPELLGDEESPEYAAKVEVSGKVASAKTWGSNNWTDG